MLLNQSPRGSFSVPVNITLQGARRRHMRDVIHQQAQLQDSGGNWRKERELKCNEKARAQIPDSSVGEDRAVLLGFLMMACSILMYLMVGILMVKPCIHSDWISSVNCSLVQTELSDEVMDCRGIVNFKCLRALVNITTSDKTSSLQLYYDEDAVNSRLKTNSFSQCFYTPKCQRNKTEQETEARNIKEALITQRENMTCFISPSHPEDAICRRKYNIEMALYYLLWPSLMLFGGIVLVGLVKLNQHLAFLCSDISIRDEYLDNQSNLVEGRIYRLLKCRSGEPTEQHKPLS
ncbi:calcium-activated potassium channel subunit beta-3-like [Danio aesculapii]|uniref:calcium-activated potassium channel subunit beta-3-like n=1 Tax=Danio aesculapii TaxID=1142201 RepID=UPI0024C03AC7|nr:calcium-activated potassium channel subunit beta-3-like [Danio aesculapii]